jgi:adenylyltransferase/sulfurtransferase
VARKIWGGILFVVLAKPDLVPRSQPAASQPTARDRLAAAGVLVIGAGGLGAPAAAHLAVAGVGRIGIIDPDRVELSNLHRQLLHRTGDVGRPKVFSARDRLRAVNPDATVEAIQDRLDTRNAERLFGRYHFVIDGSDNLPTKFLTNDAAVAQGTPYSHGGVLGFLGQTMTVVPGHSACYRCLFTAPPPPGEIPSCQEAGILGPVAGLVGIMQAAQAVAFLLGGGGLLLDRLLTYDGIRGLWRTVQVRANPRCPACAAAPMRTTPPEHVNDLC